MIYNEDDVAELKKRAQVLAMLTNTNSVTPEQVALLRSLVEKEHRQNARNVPALDHYRRFLEDVVRIQENERASEQKRHESLQRELAELKRRNEALEAASNDRRELEKELSETDRLRDKLRASEAQANLLRSKILATEEAASKVPLEVDVSALVQVIRSGFFCFVGEFRKI